MQIDQKEIKNKIVADSLKQGISNLSEGIKDAKKNSLEIVLNSEKGASILDTKTLVQAMQEKLIMILNSIDKDKIKKGKLAHLIKGLRIISDNLAKIATGADRVIEHRNLNINIDVSGKSKEELLELLNKKSQEYNK